MEFLFIVFIASAMVTGLYHHHSQGRLWYMAFWCAMFGAFVILLLIDQKSQNYKTACDQSGGIYIDGSKVL